MLWLWDEIIGIITSPLAKYQSICIDCQGEGWPSFSERERGNWFLIGAINVLICERKCSYFTINYLLVSVIWYLWELYFKQENYSWFQFGKNTRVLFIIVVTVFCALRSIWLIHFSNIIFYISPPRPLTTGTTASYYTNDEIYLTKRSSFIISHLDKASFSVL